MDHHERGTVGSYDQSALEITVLSVCEEKQVMSNVVSLLADDKGCCQAATLPDTSSLDKEVSRLVLCLLKLKSASVTYDQGIHSLLAGPPPYMYRP